MIKKLFIYISCFLIFAFIWITSSTATFGKYSTNSEVYLGKNNSCAQVITVKNERVALQFYKYGEACQIEKEKFQLDQLLKDLDAKVLWTEKTEYGISYYAFSPKLKYSCYLKGQKVNLQAFIGEENVKLASPIIYGSY